MSATAGLSLWISSMKRTSRSSRLVSSAAKSPALAITGPEVARKFTPSSRDTICASVVLPRPGGPTNSTWSSASRRARAASMNTARFERACCWPMNSASRCGRSELSAASSSRRSAVTRRRGIELKEPSSQRALPAVLVGQQLADGGNRRAVAAGYDDAGVAIIVPDQLAAAPARRHHHDRLILLARLGMAHRHDGLDPGLADLGHRPPERHRLRAHRHAPEVGVEIDPGIDAPVTRTQRCADLLPVVAVAPLDRLARGDDQLLVTRAQHRPNSASIISQAPSIPAGSIAPHPRPRRRCAPRRRWRPPPAAGRSRD